MSTLAVQLHLWGHSVTGSDTEEIFYTDAILNAHSIMIYSPFSDEHIDDSLDLVVYSSAYELSHPELQRAKELGIEIYSYPELLGTLSQAMPSLCIAGVHGKSTVTSLALQMVQALPLQVCGIVGAYPLNDGKTELTHAMQRKDFSDHVLQRFHVPDIALFEACEYKYNFLVFSPRVLLITAIESDHNDVFPDHAAIEGAFLELIARVQDKGCILICADDEGCCAMAKKIDVADLAKRGIALVWYGSSQAFRQSPALREDYAELLRYSLVYENIENCSVSMGFEYTAEDANTEEISAKLLVSGAKIALNTLAAYAGLQELYTRVSGNLFDSDMHGAIVSLLGEYRGVKRRAEVLDYTGGIWIIDDYAHHPTAIRKTLAALKAFYQPQNIVVDFMAHTYTRTAALLDDFAQSFGDADVVIVNDIYASAREEQGSITGEGLAQTIAEHNRIVCYKPDFQEAALCALSFLHPGDIFVSLGAGHSWRVAEHLVDLLADPTEESSRDG